jgi:hypothetical protein
MGIDRLLDQGLDPNAIAERLGITPYVVDVVANDERGRGRVPHEVQSEYGSDRRQRGVDAATIRAIQRMVSVRWLNLREIANEAGVSNALVEQVAAGKRAAMTTERPFVFEDLGEQPVAELHRCSTCGAPLSIVPCRACRVRRQNAIHKKVFSSGSTFFTVN